MELVLGTETCLDLCVFDILATGFHPSKCMIMQREERELWNHETLE